MGKKHVLYDPHTEQYFDIVMEEDGRITKMKLVESTEEEVSDG